jgi:hypothetical protein
LRLCVRPSGQALVAILLVLILSAGFGTYGIQRDAEDARDYYNRGNECTVNWEYDKAIANYSEATRYAP